MHMQFDWRNSSLLMRKPLVMDVVYLPGAKMVSKDYSFSQCILNITAQDQVCYSRKLTLSSGVYSLIHHHGRKLRGVLIG